MAPVQQQHTSVKSEGPEMGSFDELITPFLMDSTENFEFDENAPGSNAGDGVQLSFDGLGMIEDLGLFTQSNLEAMSEHSLVGAAAPLALAQLGPLADGSFSIQKRRKAADAIDLRQAQAPVEQPTRSAAPAATEVCSEESTRGRSRRARKRTRKVFETQEQDEEQPVSLQQPPPSLDRAARQREQVQSAQRRKQMYVDYLKQHVGGGSLDQSTASGRQRSTNLGAASSRAREEDEAATNLEATENGITGSKTHSRRKRYAKDVSSEDNKQTTRGSARRVRASTAVKDAEEAWTTDADPNENHASLQRAIALQFLKFRTSNILDRDRWCDLLDENVELVLPREPYRVSHGIHGEHNMQRVSGVDGVIRDTRSMTALVEMIRARSRWIKQLDIRARVAAHTTQLARHTTVAAGDGNTINNSEAAQTLSTGDASKKPFPSHSNDDTAAKHMTAVPASPPNSGRHDTLTREQRQNDETVTRHTSTPPPLLPEMQPQAFGQHGAENDFRRQVTAITEQAPRAEAFAKIGLQYVVDAHEMLVADRLLMCSWTLQTVGLVDVGFSSEVAVEGMLKARFTDGATRKLEKLSLSFDCMALMQQLNTHGLLDMPAVAAAASEASRSAAIARSPAPAAPPAPARPASSAAALVNNPSVLAGLAAAFPALATSLAAAAQATPGDVVTRARLLLSKFQAAQQASSAAAASVQRASLADNQVATARADGDTATSMTSSPYNSASPAPLPTAISQASPGTGTQVVNATDMARNPVMGQCLRALVAASSAKTGSPTGITSTSSGGGNTPTAAPPSAAPPPALTQPMQQQQQQLLTQCMPYLANYYSLHMALLRQQHAKAAAAATAAGLNTAQQQPQQVNVQRLQQLLQQQQAQLAHTLPLAHHQQLTHPHSQFSQQLPQQLAKQATQAQLNVQSSPGQQQAPGAAPHHQEREHEALQRPEEKQVSAQNEPQVAQPHAPISSGESLSPPAGAQHSIPSPSMPITTDGAAHAASYATPRTTTTANTPNESMTAATPVGSQGLIQHGQQPGLSIPSSISTNPVANALLGKYMSTAGSAPVMQLMANYMAMNQRQRQALQHAAASTPHIQAQQGRQ